MIRLANGWALRERQEECHDKLISAYDKGSDEFLIAAVCRFGKTVTTLQSLKDLADKRGDASQAIVVLCTMDVKGEWSKACDAVGFSRSLCETPVNEIDFDSIAERGRHVVYVSTQKLGNGSPKSIELIRWFNRHEGLKALVYDECHLGSGTDRTKEEILDRMQYDFKVYLSGTPYRSHLKEEFKFEKDLGQDITYLYSMIDERKDFEEGKIRDYVPVRLSMMVLDYQREIEEAASGEECDGFAQRYGVSSKYFKKLFSEPGMAAQALEFFGKIVEFADLKGAKNGIFFVPVRKVGQDILNRFGKKVAGRIEFRSLCQDYDDNQGVSEDEAMLESEAAKINAFFDAPNPDGKIRIAITCNKCGTGTTIKNLDFVAFLKETSNAISFIQQSQRARTPKDGKEEAYVLVFNQWSGLKAFADFAKASYADPAMSDADKVRALMESGAISMTLNLTEEIDYEHVIDILSVYHPGEALFEDFDFSVTDDIDVAQFGTFFSDAKKDLERKHPELRRDPDFQKAKTVEDLKKALGGAGFEDEAKSVERVDVRAEFQEAYVECVTFLIKIFGKSTVESLRDFDSYSDDLKAYVCDAVHIYEFDFWKRLNSEYCTYLSKICNYVSRIGTISQ